MMVACLHIHSNKYADKVTQCKQWWSGWLQPFVPGHMIYRGVSLSLKPAVCLVWTMPMWCHYYALASVYHDTLMPSSHAIHRRSTRRLSTGGQERNQLTFSKSMTPTDLTMISTGSTIHSSKIFLCLSARGLRALLQNRSALRRSRYVFNMA